MILINSKRAIKTFNEVNRLSPQVGRYFANCHEIDKANPER
jgi:hypothetical protein